MLSLNSFFSVNKTKTFIMNRILFYSVFIIAFILPSFTKSITTGIEIGDQVPEIELPDMNGKVLKLSSLQGNLVLLNFWSTWCVACNVIKSPEYVRLYETYKNNTFDTAKGFTIYSVAFDDNKDKWLNRIAEANLNWSSHVIDSEAFYSLYWYIFNIKSIPTSFLIDEKGKIIGINMTYEQLDRELAKRKKGEKEIETPSVLVPKPSVTPDIIQPTIANSNPLSGSNQANTNEVATASAITSPSYIGLGANSTNQSATIYKIQLEAGNKLDINKYGKLSAFGALQEEPVEKSTLKRLLLGAYTQKKDAEYTLLEVKKKGFKKAIIVTRNVILTPPPSNTNFTNGGATSNTTSSVTNTVYSLKLGAFKNFDKKRFSSLASLGELFTEVVNDKLQRVYIGKFKSKEEAEKAKLTANAKGFKEIKIEQRQEVENTLTAYTPTVYETAPTIAQATTESNNGGKATTQKTVKLIKVMDFPKLQVSMLGKTAPDIMLKNLVGADYPLNALRGKYAILYFWGSWSATARQNNATLNALYQKYKSKGVEIYAVAFDKNVDKWKSAISEDKLSWQTNVIETNATMSSILSAYKVDYLPALFLIDPNGNIVGENLTERQLEEELKKKLK